MVYVGGCVGVGVCVCGGILFSHEKEESHAICENMGELWGHYAKQNKPDREIQISYDVTYTWTLEKKTEFMETESRLVAARVVEVEEMGEGRYKFSALIWISSGDVMYSM